MDYYEDNHRIYHERTFYIDPSGFLEPMTRYLEPPANILDVGCGSGRDLLWFKNRGFDVTGLERSPGLVKLARENTDCTIIQADYNHFDFSSLKMQGMLLIGALVHESKDNFPLALKNISSALVDGGYMLFSLKEGQGTSQKQDGRIFQLWQKNELIPVFKDCNMQILEEHRSRSEIGTGEVWLSYLLQMV